MFDRGAKVHESDKLRLPFSCMWMCGGSGDQLVEFRKFGSVWKGTRDGLVNEFDNIRVSVLV